MKKPKFVTLAKASEDEARARIGNVLNPYIENLHSVHEARLKGILAEIKEMLETEFLGFGFEYVDIHDEQEK
jgi:hypothetical protein